MDEKERERTNWMRRNKGPSRSLVLAVVAMAIGGFGLAGVPTGAAAAGSVVLHVSNVLAPPTVGPVSKVTLSSNALSALSAVRFGPTLPPSGVHGLAKKFTAPGCLTGPCPMGVTDYGVNATGTTYTENPAVVEAAFDLYGIDLYTANGGGCIDPDAVAYACFTIQLNAVTENQYVKNTKGSYWIQNVPEIAYDQSCSTPCVSGTLSVTFLDNVWNFTTPPTAGKVCPSKSDTGKGCINPKEIVGNAYKTCKKTGGAPEYYYCESPTIYDVTLPLTVEAWTGVDALGAKGGCVVKTGTSGDSCVNFYGAVLESGTSIWDKSYDSVTLKSGSHAAGTPTFHIADANSPFGLPYDDEWVLGGPGGGSSAQEAIDGDMTSDISNCTTSTCTNYTSIEHAWSSGADTAETVSDVCMAVPVGIRQLGYIQAAADDPGTSLW